jgi:transcriptional regulator with XRE-family HTH domain
MSDASSADRSPCGELLRRYRVAAGRTQEELAERAGLSVRAWRRRWPSSGGWAHV